MFLAYAVVMSMLVTFSYRALSWVSSSRGALPKFFTGEDEVLCSVKIGFAKLPSVIASAMSSLVSDPPVAYAFSYNIDFSEGLQWHLD